MSKFPERIQTCTPAGTTARLEEAAKAAGVKPAVLVREAIDRHLREVEATMSRAA